TIYKGLSAVALARRLERDWKIPIVPVFWVAGDDHDFAEANHAWVLDRSGEPARIVLRERPPDAPLLALWRERCGDEIAAALARLGAETPDSEFKAWVLDWLAPAYRPQTSLADACAAALHALLGPRGLVVLRAHAREAKRAAAPWILKGLPVTLPDGHTPVLVEASQVRDRLRAAGDAFVPRRRGARRARGQAAGAPSPLAGGPERRPRGARGAAGARDLAAGDGTRARRAARGAGAALWAAGRGGDAARRHARAHRHIRAQCSGRRRA